MIEQPRLGRIAQRDLRDERYPVRAVLRGIPAARWRYWYDNGAWRDQGDTGTCVGHGWAHWCEDSPVTHPGEDVDPFQWYADAVKLDPWPENDGPDWYFGTTVRAGAKVAQQRGMVAEYRWVNGTQDLIDTVLGLGPVVIGVDWYEDMFEPRWERDALGDLRKMVVPGGLVAGGHCLVINGVSLDRGTFRLKNSWGRGWGVDGRASIRIDDMAMLLETGGEGCIAFERRVA